MLIRANVVTSRKLLGFLKDLHVVKEWLSLDGVIIGFAFSFIAALFGVLCLFVEDPLSKAFATVSGICSIFLFFLMSLILGAYRRAMIQYCDRVIFAEKSELLVDGKEFGLDGSWYKFYPTTFGEVMSQMTGFEIFKIWLILGPNGFLMMSAMSIKMSGEHAFTKAVSRYVGGDLMHFLDSGVTDIFYGESVEVLQPDIRDTEAVLEIQKQSIRPTEISEVLLLFTFACAYNENYALAAVFALPSLPFFLFKLMTTLAYVPTFTSQWVKEQVIDY